MSSSDICAVLSGGGGARHKLLSLGFWQWSRSAGERSDRVRGCVAPVTLRGTTAKMGAKLTMADEGMHPVGEAKNWNESTYVDLFDPTQRVGAWFRLGNRPNERYSEMSACVNLPDGRDAFFFERARIERN